MPSCIILDQYAAYTPLGALAPTVDGLLCGAHALQPAPCLGVPVASAPFPDLRYRDLRFAGSRIFAQMQIHDADVLLFCCAKGDIRMLEDHIAGRPLSTTIPPILDSQAGEIAAISGQRFSRIMTVSNACASGAIAMEIAREMLIAGAARRIVLFGLDTLSHFVISGFYALNALSAQGARPFDASRDGLTPGECAVAAVLTIRPPRQGDIIVAGAGSSNDANHRTGPSRTGEGLLLAAQACLHDAAMTPGEVGAVKCHGTGTVYNDAMEAKALAALFGNRMPPCVSVKGALGHTSGAGALLEILIAAECLRRRTLPPTARYQTRGVEECIPISSSAQPVAAPSILCLAAGFGGVNAAVALQEAT